MNTKESPHPVGAVFWADLTVPDAESLRSFYRETVGWRVSDFDMGGYSDYCMNEPESGKTVAGVCHARGQNEGLPPQWLIYIAVADLNASLASCLALGGAVVFGPKPFCQGGRFAVIRDPAGAVAALVEAGPKDGTW